MSPSYSENLPVRLTVEPEGDSALRVAFADTISLEVMDAVRRFTAALEETEIPGVNEVVPSYSTVTIYYEHLKTDWRALCTAILALDYSTSVSLPEVRTWDIPVCYDGSHGPDLGDVAGMHGMTPTAVIEMHSQAEYVVAAVGFVPGFAYLYGLPSDLETPRLSSPRIRIPPGSVAIGGAQTGIYPLETPGGWRIIGNTHMRLFDPARDEPALLRPGDRVRFRPITIQERAQTT